MRASLFSSGKYNICLAGLEDGIINDLELNIRKEFPEHQIVKENSFTSIKKFIKKVDILITGFNFIDAKGNELIGELRSIRPDFQIIVILNDYLSASIMFHHNVNAALPNYKNADIIIKHLKLAIMYLDSQIQFENLNPNHKCIIEEQTYVCSDQSIQEVFMDAAKYAIYEKPILIQGESGVGKEHLAKYIHLKSKRKGKFVPINCGNISENLFESEIFGYAKGAFTGADEDKDGYVVNADNGTLFLDEVESITWNAQVKFLRFLQNGEFYKIGDSKMKYSNARIISGTNKNLSDQTKIRNDFLQRISGHKLIIPPLKERKNDLRILIQMFIDKYSREKKKICEIDSEAYNYLLEYDYPGNIRELSRIIDSAITLDSNITKELLTKIIKTKI